MYLGHLCNQRILPRLSTLYNLPPPRPALHRSLTLQMEQEKNNNNPTSETDPNSPTHKKHEAMLHRLSLLHQTASIPKPQQQQQQDSDSISSFLSLFSSRLSSIQSHLSLLLSNPNPNPNPNPKSSLDEISASISDLEQLLAQNSYYLPSYDLRFSLSSIQTLKQSLSLAFSQLLPKQKFSFKNKSKNKTTKPSTAPVIEPSPSPVAVPDAKKPSPGFRSKKGATLVKNFRVSEVEFTLSDLDSCVVYLKGRFRALFIDHIKNCRIFCGPVLGSVLIEEVSGCLFVLASHQIRIHKVRETDFYLRVRSRPIIEDCEGVRFGPYRLRYEGIEEELRESRLGEETGNWANVDDFKWLRAVQSPNWCLIPEEDWVEPVDASDLEENCEDC